MAKVARQEDSGDSIRDGRQERPDSHPIYCLVPPELPELAAPLADHFADDAGVTVLVERRRRERRSGDDRRAPGMSPPDGLERRIGQELEGRRFADRRSPIVPVEAPPLPPEARPHVKRLRFVMPAESEAERQETARLRALAAAWRERCADAVREARENLVEEQTQGVQALSAALAARDSYTWEHAAGVVWLALACADQMRLGSRDVAEVNDVAMLHDIGKLGVPDAILSKPGSLSDVEWEVMRRHPAIGAEIVSSTEALRHLAPAIRAEHERWDGLGYPDGLAGDEIPVSSQMVFVCDAYHAMISDRPYREALSAEAAAKEIADNAGTQFSPDCARALLDVLDNAAPGSVDALA